MYTTRARRLIRSAVVGTVLAASAAIALPAGAAHAATTTVPCGSRTMSRPFTLWSDTNQYFTVQDGTFESGAAGWTRTGGAAAVSGNEPWKVVSATNAKSLMIPAGGSATTPAMCVASDEDSTRFFYKSPGVSGSSLHVSIYVTSGVNVATNDFDVAGSVAGWGVSPRIMLPDIRDASGQQTVKITFSIRNTPATWQIDDVMIDPWRTL